MRLNVDGASLKALAMRRELQWVQPVSSVLSVALTTSETFSSITVRGAWFGRQAAQLPLGKALWPGC